MHFTPRTETTRLRKPEAGTRHACHGQDFSRNPRMYAWLIEDKGHRPMLRFEDGHTGIPVNLHLLTRQQFLRLIGRRVEIRSQLSPDHYTVRFPNPDDTLPI
jgi:hypothetical protein